MTNELLTFLLELDTHIFLFFNGSHAPFWDVFMKTFTGTFIWVPMYATILYLLLKNYSWKVALCYVVAIALTITFADQICGSLIRPEVGRLRPANLENPIVNLVHIVNGYRGGPYGFPSCHAANSFGLFSYVLFTFHSRRLTLFFLAWALVNCYTRIYLGVHYPGDLLVGALIGGSFGWLFSTLAHKGSVMLESDSYPRQAIVHSMVPIFAGGTTILCIFAYSLLKWI